jgi:hypothetical protein
VGVRGTMGSSMNRSRIASLPLMHYRVGQIVENVVFPGMIRGVG